tara:strand:- start:316 stop:1008 length:693 start_codon:yes stop_codon:yes gene_type:complete
MAIQLLTIGDDGTVLQNVLKLPTGTEIGGSTVAALGTVTSTSANAIAAGPAGTTNPTLKVDASTASAATGLKIKSAAAAGGLALSVITSGTNESLTIDAAGSGTLSLNATATGAIIAARALRYKVVTTAVAAAGTTVADAAQLAAANIVHITSDGSGKGVKLQTGVMGDEITVVNDSSTAAELYAASGGTVNGLSPDASVVVPASKGLWCQCTAADTWICFDLPAKATAS